MSLDKLYDIIKDVEYPIRNRDEVEWILGDEKFEFEGSLYDGRDVALSIEKFPIKTSADFMKFFVQGFEEYSEKETRTLKKAMT